MIWVGTSGWVYPHWIGRFFHNGAHGIGLSEDELRVWADRIAAAGAGGCDVYTYFNNDPEGCALRDALRLRELLADRGASLAGL